MAVHAEDALGRTRVAKVFDLSFTVSASEALRAERLVARQDGQVFDLVATGVAAIGAIAADQGAVA